MVGGESNDCGVERAGEGRERTVNCAASFFFFFGKDTAQPSGQVGTRLRKTDLR